MVRGGPAGWICSIDRRFRVALPSQPDAHARTALVEALRPLFPQAGIDRRAGWRRRNGFDRRPHPVRQAHQRYMQVEGRKIAAGRDHMT